MYSCQTSSLDNFDGKEPICNYLIKSVLFSQIFVLFKLIGHSFGNILHNFSTIFNCLKIIITLVKSEYMLRQSVIYEGNPHENQTALFEGF